MAEKDLLERVRRSFLRMTSPHEFSSQGKRRQETIVSANVPPLLARADAAADTVFALLKRDLIVSMPDTERNAVYCFARKLTAEAENCAGEAMQNAAADKRKLDVAAFLEYMEFLELHLDILIALTKAQTLVETRSKSSLLTSVFQRQDLLCSAGELSILPFLQESVSSLSTAFEKNREQYKKNFSKTDSERYARAYDSFIAVYQKNLDKLA